MKKGTFILDNITANDVKVKQIRVTVYFKDYFPVEVKGQPQTRELKFKYADDEFVAKYTIGSQDGNSRSGILKFGSEVYTQKLKIQKNTNLKISSNGNSEYVIEKIY